MRLFAFLLPLLFLSAVSYSPQGRRALFGRIDPTSITKLVAFTELFPQTFEGVRAREQLHCLLGVDSSMPEINLSAALDLLSAGQQETRALSSAELDSIDRIATHLGNRTLRGFRARNISEVECLEDGEIDLARALLLTQIPPGERQIERIRSIEAALDIMALQVALRVPKNPTAQDYIRELNHLIFGELGFRFPNEISAFKEIDTYSDLASVLSSRRGVCLGVSLLYASLGQRLYLPLEFVTPPGHIYVRYRQGDELINIETTARGVHVDCEQYLGLQLAFLPVRTYREAIGMSHFNRASIEIAERRWEDALQSYNQAAQYMNDDLTLQLQAIALWLNGEEKRAREQIKSSLQQQTHRICSDGIVEDILEGHAPPEVVADLVAVGYLTLEEGEQKLAKLREITHNFPRFRAGRLALAETYAGLGFAKQTYDCLNDYHAIDPNHPMVEFQLTLLSAQRLDYPKAQEHFARAEQLLHRHSRNPTSLWQCKLALFTQKL